jgi:hypothetical protein
MTLRAKGLARIRGCGHIAAKKISALTDRLKVDRIHAVSNFAEVVDLKPRRDCPNRQLIGDPVCGRTT